MPREITHAIFPPALCRICTLFASLYGMELSKALGLMRRAFQQPCTCGYVLGAHGAEHPHAMASVGCTGIGMETNEARNQLSRRLPRLFKRPLHTARQV